MTEPVVTAKTEHRDATPARARSDVANSVWRALPRPETGHRATEMWMGQEVETLTATLLRPGLKAVVVGINPSPVSVAAGHYYQGQLGHRFYKRLHEAGVIDLNAGGFEDDVAFAAGIGFTGVVKRSTREPMACDAASLITVASCSRQTD